MHPLDGGSIKPLKPLKIADTALEREELAARELMDAMQAEAPLKPGQRWWGGLYLDLRMRIVTHRVFDRNLVGLTLASRKLSEGVVLVGAHHDGVGLDAEGRVRFVGDLVGPHEFHAQFPAGPLVIAVHDVVARPRRWLYALILTPLGLLVIVWNFKKLRRGP